MFRKIIFILSLFFITINSSSFASEAESKSDVEIKKANEPKFDQDAEYTVSVCGYGGIIPRGKMNPTELALLASINPDFDKEDYFVLLNVNDYVIEQEKKEQKDAAPVASAAPATVLNDNVIGEPTKDLQMYGGFLDAEAKLRLEPNQFPSYLPLSLFIKNRKFVKDREPINVIMQNMLLQNGRKITILFRLIPVQKNRWSDKQVGPTIDLALENLHKNYHTNKLLAQFPDQHSLIPKPIKDIILLYLIDIDYNSKKQTLEKDEDEN